MLYVYKDSSLDEELSLELDDDDIAFTGCKKTKVDSKYSIEMTMANLLFETLSSKAESSNIDSEVNKDKEKHRKIKKPKKWIKFGRGKS
jgi:phosphoribosylaminoimidazole-succinocarboxamide synthase